MKVIKSLSSIAKCIQQHIASMAVILILLSNMIIGQSGITKEINGNLVSVDWLEKNLKNNNLIILDASFAQMYTAQHIPGALNADFILYGILETPISEIEKRCQSLGISPDKKIVIYDQGAPMMATRLFYDLYYYGFPVKNLFILNGGFAKWQEKGKPATAAPSSLPSKSTFKIKNINEKIRAKLPEFLAATGDAENNVMLEALDPGWHFGELQIFDRPGHIPNGILLSRTDFFNQDNTFKSADEILKMLNYFGIKKEQKIYTYCGGGVAASVPFFALKFILNFPDVKLFRESEMGWMKDDRELPFWTYDAPYLLRQSNWIKTWAGKMFRTYGILDVSIIDVNSSGEFEKGHIPFAVNIPSNVFRNNIATPEKLIAILSQKGINISNETVAVSGKGLDENTALAFLMLECVGQKKVSVFMDSYEKLSQSGVSLTKDAEEASLKKPGQDISITSTENRIKLKKEVLISDPNSTKGLYDKIFIASGKSLPGKTLKGKVIHLPYTDLLNSDGTPKPAKEIWKILQNSKVPRYAEIVCVSDNPGESAIIYFILKLMGFPDIKVLLV